MKNKNKSVMSKIPWWGWIFIILLIPNLLFSLFSSDKKEEPAPETKAQQKVKKENRQTQASVNFTGTQFVVTNKNDFNWERVEIIVNEKYRYKAGGMKAGSTYEIGAGQFTDRKNVRFNPFELNFTSLTSNLASNPPFLS